MNNQALTLRDLQKYYILNWDESKLVYRIIFIDLVSRVVYVVLKTRESYSVGPLRTLA